MADQINLSSEYSSDENDDTNCPAMLLDLEALNCPICYDALTSSIYQCDNGHIACSICCDELGNICPYCDFPIGQIRCRAMERILQSVFVPCPNAKLGCNMSFSYGSEIELTHKKECAFSRCHCPAENCDYTGSYKDLYSHLQIHLGKERTYWFMFGDIAGLYFDLTKCSTSVLKEEYHAGPLFVVQCIREPHGICVTVSCIAPSAPEVGEFSCHISTAGRCTMTFEVPRVKKIRKLRLQTPEEDFLLVPSYFLRESQALHLRVCIRKLNQE